MVRSRCVAPSRCGQSTPRQKKNSCKANRRRLWISVTTTERDLRLTVLNPGGRDLEQDFSSGAPAPNDHEHAPVNFHGYAACTHGVFQRDVARAIDIGRPVLLLLRGDFKETQRALVELKKRELPVAVSLKETGLHQIARQLSDPKRAERFRDHHRSGRCSPGGDAGGAGVLWQRCPVHSYALSDN